MKRVAAGFTVGVLLLLILIWPTHAEPLKLVHAKLVDQSGGPLVNQTVLIEGTKQPQWYTAWGLIGEKSVRVISVTDTKGYLQVVDLPAGTYTMKLVAPGFEHKPIKNFTLDASYKNVEFTGKVVVPEGFKFEKWLPKEPKQ